MEYSEKTGKLPVFARPVDSPAMQVFDLSQEITGSMPVYPGTEPPCIEEACTIATHGFAEKRISLFSHTGTHIDAPGHILEGASRLDRFEAGHFAGPGCLLDVSGCAAAGINKAVLQKHEKRIASVRFVLLYTGWAKYWTQPEYLAGYPVLTIPAARWLAGFNLHGIGVDAISVDEMNSPDMPVHRVLFENNLLVIENLTGLDALPDRDFLFSCLPLKLAGGDGSPVRAVAMV